MRPHQRLLEALVLNILRIGAAITIAAYLFQKVSVAKVGALIGQADFAWVSAAFVLGLLEQVAVAIRLQIITDAYAMSLSTFEVFDANLATRFYGLFLPGGTVTATAIRLFKLVRRNNKYGSAVVAIALDRWMTTLVMVGLGLFFGFLVRNPMRSRWFLIMAITSATMALPFIGLITLRSRRARRQKFVASNLKSDYLPSIADSLSRIPASNWVLIVSWSMLAHMIGTAQYVALAQSVNVGLGMATAGWVRSVVLLVALIPISISGLGIRDGVVLLLLPAYGVLPESAVAFSLLVFAVSHVALGLIGGVLQAIPYCRQRTMRV